jgi:alpha-amylase/alpha-mannosidase (GH57 family)
MTKFICIHGHFYQPPRENPWLEFVELQDSAYPFHDWNERVTAECYAPNTASRILDAQNRIVDIINNYSRISFNVGPTLCAWLERHQPNVLAAIVEADRMSKERFSGHGSAIAQVYNHMIMPLANKADKYSQVYWGIVDFSRRFGRFPEGMWLPETAVDLETLDVLSELNIRFTLLAPRQAKRVRSFSKGARWHNVGEGIDPTTPYLCRLPSGRSIVLFFYDGPISQEMAFGGLLDNGERFAHRLMEAFSDDRTWTQIVHAATDGESYGHHHRHGDMALSYCLHTIEQAPDVTLTNYGEFLEKNPPQHEVEIHENSSWSCVHGIERWRSDCGCNSGRSGWHQAWRSPLRRGLDQLRDSVAPLYEESAKQLLIDPWKARNDYIDIILDRQTEHVDQFITHHAAHTLSQEDQIRVLKLLELQRNCMLMYTSCGWFFDDITGIETVQILQYAARAIQLAEDLFTVPLEEQLLSILREAPSNVLKNGEEAYLRYAKTACLDLLRIGAHYAISSLFAEIRVRTSLYCYLIDTSSAQMFESGKFKLGLGKITITSVLTRESARYSYAVLHFGDHNVSGGVREFQGDEAFEQMQSEIRSRFQRGFMTDILPLMITYFGTHNYSLWHLFRDEQRRVLNDILADAMAELRASFKQIYDKHFAVMSFMLSLNHLVPGPLRSVAEHMAREDLKEYLQQDPPAVDGLELLLERATQWHFDLRTEDLALAMAAAVDRQVLSFAHNDSDVNLLEQIQRVLGVLKKLNPEINLWRAQNAFFDIAARRFGTESKKAEVGDPASAAWVRHFSSVGQLLGMKVGS